MKRVLTSLLLFVGTVAFSQTAGPVQVTSQTTTVTITPKAKSLCKTWNLSQTENFGDVHKPTDQQKYDLLNLQESGRYRLTMDGNSEAGIWTLSKDNLWITLTTDAGAIKKFKVIESTASTLKVDYRDADDIHNILYYSSEAAVSPK